MSGHGRRLGLATLVTAMCALALTVAGCSTPLPPPTPVPPDVLAGAGAERVDGTPAVPDGLIENGRSSDLVAGRATAPTLRWTAPWPVGGAFGPSGTQVLQRDGLILVSGGPADGSHFAVAALDSRTGRLLWKQEGVGPHLGLSVLGDLLIETPVLGGEKHWMSLVVEVATGAVRWTAPQQALDAGPPGSGAVIGDGRVLDADTGRVRWTFPAMSVGTDEPPVVPASMPYGLVLQDCRAGTLRALDWLDGHQLWKVGVPSACPAGAVPAGRLVVVLAGPRLIAYTSTGARAWSWNLGTQSLLAIQPLGPAATAVLPWDGHRITRIDNATGVATTVQVGQGLVGLVSMTTPTGTTVYQERQEGVTPLSPATLASIGDLVPAHPEIQVDLAMGLFDRMLSADSAYVITAGQDAAGHSIQVLQANDLATGRVRWQIPAPGNGAVVSPGPVILVHAGQKLQAYG
jgi:outer membrane protein assembly factor BamB